MADNGCVQCVRLYESCPTKERKPRDDAFSGMHELMRVMFAMGSVGFEVPSPVPT